MRQITATDGRGDEAMLAQTLRWTAVLAALVSAQAHAQEKPPASVGGFRYQLLKQGMHMNVCEASVCTPGSKVSYLFLPPDPEPSLEKYRAERARVAEALRKRAAPGTALIFAPIERTKDKAFTIFKANREESYPDGRRIYVLNWRFHGAHATGEIISSSRSKRAAEQNLALFAIPVMMTLMKRPNARPGESL
jgi:hypothetical protein